MSPDRCSDAGRRLPEAALHPVSVTLDSLDGKHVKAFWNGAMWNGFVSPLLPLESMVVLAVLLADAIRYDAITGRIYCVEYGEEIASMDVTVDGTPLRAFALDWCWFLADTPP